MAFIDRLYESLCTQTYRKFEWVCVDDGSTDGTVAYLRTLRPPGTLGMQVYKLPQNSGASMAIVLGVQRARGEAIVIMDHDDEFMPHGLAAVRDNWPKIAGDDGLCGLMFQAAHPNGQMIGRPIPPGKAFTHSWMMNAFPDAHDVTFAIKAADAKACHDPQTLEGICSWGVVMSMLTERKRFLAGIGSPIRYYHRDNPNSQMNAWKVSRKWVQTYALYLDQADRHYWRRPGKWLRHAISTVRFAKIVHGSHRAAFRLVHRPIGKTLVALAMIPAAVLDLFSSKDLEVRDMPPFPVEALDCLPDLCAHPTAASI
jgi:glycosyltransferase involved in cell wall biosynthesis